MPLPPLQPLTADWMSRLLASPMVLQELLSNYGSPVNIHHLASFKTNVSIYRQVFNSYQLPHKIFFARKANRCKALVHAAKHIGCGVDTASFAELQQALDIGLAPNDLVLTAACKNKNLLLLCITSGVPVMLDNIDEFELTIRLAKQIGKAARIGVRVSGFDFEGEKLYSRFGVDITQVYALMKRYFSSEETAKHLHYEGLHFHLNGYSPEQRGAALLQCLELASSLKTLNLTTSFIDMGGGLLMNYLADRQQWKNFETSLKDAVLGQRPPITFGNNGLGYEIIDGELKGSMKVYPYYNECAKADFLSKILEYTDENGKSAVEEARKSKISLRIEPGRSLLDQVGITIARVAYRKKDSRGDWLVGLEMNMTQMHSSSADFLLDPFVLYQDPRPDEGTPTDVYFTGAYCLERDVLLKRKISLKKLPMIGDLVVFPNTAGYMMHFFESEAHLFPLAENLIIAENEEGLLSMEDFSSDG